MRPSSIMCQSLAITSDGAPNQATNFRRLALTVEGTEAWLWKSLKAMLVNSLSSHSIRWRALGVKLTMVGEFATKHPCSCTSSCSLACWVAEQSRELISLSNHVKKNSEYQFECFLFSIHLEGVAFANKKVNQCDFHLIKFLIFKTFCSPLARA